MDGITESPAIGEATPARDTADSFSLQTALAEARRRTELGRQGQSIRELSTRALLGVVVAKFDDLAARVAHQPASASPVDGATRPTSSDLDRAMLPTERRAAWQGFVEGVAWGMEPPQVLQATSLAEIKTEADRRFPAASPVETEATPAGEMSSERVADIVNAAKMAVEGTWRGRVNTKVIASRLDDLDALFASHERSSAEVRSLREALAAAQRATAQIETGPTRCRNRKMPHVGDGFLHADDDDGWFEVDGVLYCGRCHWTCNELGTCNGPAMPPENAAERIELALKNCGIGGIYDVFKDPADAIEQMALHIKELSERLAESESSARSLREEREALQQENVTLEHKLRIDGVVNARIANVIAEARRLAWKDTPLARAFAELDGAALCLHEAAEKHFGEKDWRCTACGAVVAVPRSA